MTTRLYLDTEFTDMLDCELLSVGLVSEDGHSEFYAELADADRSLCNDFCRLAVVPQLGADPAHVGTEEAVSARLKAWLTQFEQPVLVRVDHPIDWELLSYLARDTETLQMPAWLKGQSVRVEPRLIEEYWRLHGRRAHHALHDARALRYAWLHSEQMPT